MNSSPKLRALLIDDELHCIETLRYELRMNCPQVEVMDTASSGPAGIEKIQALKPDLVFLDIEMPGMSGFELLRQLGNVDFAVIFVTAYDQYALQAFRCAATDYLLKPVISEQLKEAVNRVISQSGEPQNASLQLEALLYNLRDGLKSPRIALPTSRGIDFVDAGDILYCNAESNYTHVMLNGQKKYTLSKTLKDVEEMLEHLNFFRVHQSYLINFNHMQRYVRDDGGYVVMQDGAQIPISKRKKEEFLSKLKMA
jgi:two-component system LytT family response regulator